MSIAPAKKKEATYQDLFKIPENMVGEIIDGELFTQSRPAAPHAFVYSNLGGQLVPPFSFGDGGGPGGWVILDEPELHLGPRPDILVPDLAGWQRTRLPPEALEEAYFTVAADWVCEIVSPSTESKDRIKKMHIYAREKIAHAWIINPLAKTLEVYQLDGETWRLVLGAEDQEVVRAQPFDAIELRLGLLWTR